MTLVTLMLLAWAPRATAQVSQFFRDDFNGAAIDSTKWNTAIATSGVRWNGHENEGPGNWALPSGAYGSINVSNSMATFADAGATPCVFPYIFAGPPSRTSPFPANGDFILEVRMKYETSTLYGTGLIVRYWPASDPVDNNAPVELDSTVLNIWQDTSGLVVYLVGAGSKTVGFNNLDFHTYRLEFVDSTYSLFIDGSLVLGPSASSLRPNAVWLGNSVIAQHTGWTKFTIDYINVSSTRFASWSDNFESYETGAFPSSGGWVLVYNGSGSSNQYVDDSYSVSGTKSLHLVGSSCWSANAFHAVDMPSQVSLEAMVFIDAIVNCGCTNGIAGVGLCDPDLGTWGTGYGGVKFACDGKIYAGQSTYNGQYDVLLGSYQPRQWYHVRVNIDLVSRLFDVYINGSLCGSGLQVMDSGTPKGINLGSGHGNNPTVWFDDVKVGAATTDENTIAGSIPRLKDVPTAPATIGTDIGLGLATVLVFYLAATVFNSTLKENYEIIQDWLGRASARLRFRRTSASKTIKDRRAGIKPMIKVFLEAAAVAAICAAIYVFLDPYFKNSLRGSALFLSLFIGIIIVTLAYEGTQVFWSARRFRVPAAIKIYWIAIVVAAICVAFSRAINFHPGLIYGFVGAYAALSISRDKRLDKGQQAMTILAGTIVILAVAVSAFFLREFVINRWGGESFGRILAEDILVAAIAIGLEGLVFALAIPVAFMDGGKLRSRNFWEWLVVACIIAFVFYWIIINKDGKIQEAASNMKFIAMYVLMGLSLTISWGMWLFFWVFRLRRKRLREAKVAVEQPKIQAVTHAQYCPKCHEAVAEGSNFCAKCGAPLSLAEE